VKTGSVSLGFGTADLAKAPVKIDVKHGAAPATADITLSPSRATRVALPLGIALPLEKVVLSGTAHLELPASGQKDVIRGTLAIVAKHYVPPHPPELDGIVYGDRTTFDSKLEIDAARTTVTLTDGKVKAGAFQLAGGGKLERGEGFTKVDLDFKGSIPCSEVVRSAANARLGGALGSFAGGIGSQLVKGSVSVRVHIVGDTRDLGAARLDRTVGVGCGLQQFCGKDFPQLPDLPLPPGLPELPFPVPSGAR
jgi:hypothetical protein